MRYIRQHIESIINAYNGGVPLTHFLKNYFRLHPKLGSRDRKILGEMSYCWYRCSKGFDNELHFEQKLYACIYLCDTQSKHILSFLPEKWQQSKALPANEKISILGQDNIIFDIDRLTGFTPSLSGGITKEEWLYSMLQQPDLFIRARNKPLVADLLREHNISHQWASESCIRMANGTPVDKLLPADSYVVQDASSQQTGKYFQPQDKEKWWDCCSGAGGKSLLLTDLNNRIHLTVSDKRESIIHNLLQRFRLYGLKAPESLILDVSDTANVKKKLQGRLFDHIICDVPCTGSGTWARTPEQLYFFDPAMIADVSKLQSSIVSNASGYLKKGGTLFYITCSVFKEENENVVSNITQSTALVPVETQLINGVAQKADSMFISVLEKE